MHKVWMQDETIWKVFRELRCCYWRQINPLVQWRYNSLSFLSEKKIKFIAFGKFWISAYLKGGLPATCTFFLASSYCSMFCILNFLQKNNMACAKSVFAKINHSFSRYISVKRKQKQVFHSNLHHFDFLVTTSYIQSKYNTHTLRHR